MQKIETKKVTVGIDPLSILVGIAVLLGIYVVWQLNVLLIVLFVSFIISSALKPIVDRLEIKYKIHRMVSIASIFVVGLVLVSILGIMVAGNLSKELEGLNLNEVVVDFWDKIDEILPGDQSKLLELGNGYNTALTTQNSDDSGIVSQFDIQSILHGTNYVIQLFGKTVGTFFIFFTILIISFYMLSRKENVYDGIIGFLPRKQRESVKKLLHLIEKKLGNWLSAQFFLMLFVGILTYLGLSIPSLFVPGEYFTIGRFAVTFAVVAGILELVPNIGPVITMVIALIFSIATGGDVFLGQAIYVAIYFSLVQQIENNIIVPKVMKQAVGIDPIITILSVMGAYTLMGPIGAILIIPMVAVVLISIEFYSGDKRIQTELSKE